LKPSFQVLSVILFCFILALVLAACGDATTAAPAATTTVAAAGTKAAAGTSSGGTSTDAIQKWSEIKLSDASLTSIKKAGTTGGITDLDVLLYGSPDDVAQTAADAKAVAITKLGYNCTDPTQSDQMTIVACTLAGKPDVVYIVGKTDPTAVSAAMQGVTPDDLSKINDALKNQKSFALLDSGTGFLKLLSGGK